VPLSVVYINVDGQPMSEIRGGVVTEYVHDPLGNLIATNTSVGIVTWTGDYWPYGESIISSGTKANSWGFCAAWGYYDDGYDNSYVRRRILRRKLARWQTVDPLWPRESAYGYAEWRPNQWTDPTGRAILIPLLIGGAIIVGGALAIGTLHWVNRGCCEPNQKHRNAFGKCKAMHSNCGLDDFLKFQPTLVCDSLGDAVADTNGFGGGCRFRVDWKKWWAEPWPIACTTILHEQLHCACRLFFGDNDDRHTVLHNWADRLATDCKNKKRNRLSKDEICKRIEQGVDP